MSIEIPIVPVYNGDSRFRYEPNSNLWAQHSITDEGDLRILLPQFEAKMTTVSLWLIGAYDTEVADHEYLPPAASRPTLTLFERHLSDIDEVDSVGDGTTSLEEYEAWHRLELILGAGKGDVDGGKYQYELRVTGEEGVRAVADCLGLGHIVVTTL